ncbi:hypothetical protein TREES_T100007266 [Tupaia chinensis]|uniref:Uncharacterized protein n=1 Tax=Tupaia chinensis TaxID=246437 RepID=L9L082_TUPCH|nr:hypothetical protein TREES_T100007266 [Tupaia chinensis]
MKERKLQSRPQEPAPSPGRVASGSTVFNVAEQGQKKEETGADISPSHDSCHRLCVNGVGGKHQASHEGPVAITKEDLGEAREETSDCRMQQDVDKMVAPGVQPSNGMVQAKGEGTERPVCSLMFLSAISTSVTVTYSSCNSRGDFSIYTCSPGAVQASILLTTLLISTAEEKQE